LTSLIHFTEKNGAGCHPNPKFIFLELLPQNIENPGWHMARSTGNMAPGTRHMTPGTWHPAHGTRNPAPGTSFKKTNNKLKYTS
jgi:hypothetical protein